MVSADPKPNFFVTNSVLINQPISKVFEVIGTAAGHERTCRLSALCSMFELEQRDYVALPRNLSLADASVRTLHPSKPVLQGEDAETRLLPRQFFKMTERIPILFGLFHKDVQIAGTLTWDEHAHLALYETLSDQGIIVWKLRKFEEEGEGEKKKTRVTEQINGWSPMLLRPIVQSEANKGHAAHLESYSSLFTT